MPQAFGLVNGVLPVAGLMAMAALLPMLFAGWIGERQGRLALVMLFTAGAVLVVGAALLAFLTISQNATATEDPLTYLARSAMMAIGWGPIWALVWLIRAQGVETRKGLKMQHEAGLEKHREAGHGRLS